MVDTYFNMYLISEQNFYIKGFFFILIVNCSRYTTDASPQNLLDLSATYVPYTKVAQKATAWTMANGYYLDAFKILYIRLNKYKLTWRVLCLVNLLRTVIKEQNEIYNGNVCTPLYI